MEGQAAADQVNKVQACGWVHPLTCGTCEPPERDERPLVAHWVDDAVLLRCPICGVYEQVMSADLLGIFLSLSGEPEVAPGSGMPLKPWPRDHP